MIKEMTIKWDTTKSYVTSNLGEDVSAQDAITMLEYALGEAEYTLQLESIECDDEDS